MQVKSKIKRLNTKILRAHPILWYNPMFHQESHKMDRKVTRPIVRETTQANNRGKLRG